MIFGRVSEGFFLFRAISHKVGINERGEVAFLRPHLSAQLSDGSETITERRGRVTEMTSPHPFRISLERGYESGDRVVDEERVDGATMGEEGALQKCATEK